MYPWLGDRSQATQRHPSREGNGSSNHSRYQPSLQGISGVDHPVKRILSLQRALLALTILFSAISVESSLASDEHSKHFRLGTDETTTIRCFFSRRTQIFFAHRSFCVLPKEMAPKSRQRPSTPKVDRRMSQSRICRQSCRFYKDLMLTGQFQRSGSRSLPILGCPEATTCRLWCLLRTGLLREEFRKKRFAEL